MYRMVLNEQGLYLLELGKAMGPRIDSNIIAEKIIDKMQENRERHYAEKEKEFAAADLQALVDNKKNFLIQRADVKEVRLAHRDTAPKLDIKSSVLNISLHFYPNDMEKLEKVYEYLKG